MTLTILGCGTLGTAILSGIIQSIIEHSRAADRYTAAAKNVKELSSAIFTRSYPLTANLNDTKFRLIACVQREESVKRIETAISHFQPLAQQVQVLRANNLRGAQAADVVILGCKPGKVANVLGEQGIRDALKGKLLISICGGVTVDQIAEVLYGTTFAEAMNLPEACEICRVMPNTAAFVRESMTIIATSNPSLSTRHRDVTEWILSCVGRVTYLPPSLMDIGTTLCGSGPAFHALYLEALIDEAEAMGLPRSEARRIAAWTMRGTTGLVLNGEDPATIRGSVCTPGGSSYAGVVELEAGDLRGIVSQSVKKATIVAGQLSTGV